MITIVFALAVANLGLGFALAIALDRFPVLSTLGLRHSVIETTSVIQRNSGSVARESTNEPKDEWSQKLADAEVEAKSVIERLLWIVKLETASRRQRVIELDRAFFDPQNEKSIANELKQELESLQSQFEAWIAEADAEKEQAEVLGQSLEEVLLDQACQLRSCVDGLAENCDDVSRQLSTAINALNQLRDRADDLLCQLLTTEDRLHCVADRHRIFGERNTLTHLGLAALFDEWWDDDEDHVRLVSLVMLDLDRFEPFTQQVGAAWGDIAIDRFGDLLHDLVRKDRGFDRVARYGGQRFLMFLGDTSFKNASKGAERFRQTIESTSIKLGEDNSIVTASLGVIEVGKTEGPREFLPRLEAALDAAKAAGRNCGFVDAGSGPVPINLPSFQVASRVIALDGGGTVCDS